MSVIVLLIAGLVAGAGLALFMGSRRLGCWSLIIVPIAAIGYVSWWQAMHPENLRSTSGLEFVFVPPWPTLAALAGYSLVWVIKDWLDTKDS